MENYNQNSRNEIPVTVGQWMITMLIAGLPIIGVVMLFVWAFGDNVPQSKSNWAKATLIWALIGTVLVILCWSFLAAMLFARSTAPIAPMSF